MDLSNLLSSVHSGFASLVWNKNELPSEKGDKDIEDKVKAATMTWEKSGSVRVSDFWWLSKASNVKAIRETSHWKIKPLYPAMCPQSGRSVCEPHLIHVMSILPS